MDITLFSFDKYKKLINVALIAVICMFAVNFKWQNELTYMTAQCLFMAYVIFILLILRSKLFNYIFEPPIFFLLFSLTYEFLKFPYYFRYDEPTVFVDSNYLLNSTYRINDYYASSSYMLINQFFCIIILLVSYKFSALKHQIINYDVKTIKEASETNVELVLVISTICFLIFGYIGLFIITKGNFLYLLTRRAGNEQAWEVLKSNYTVSLASTLSLMFTPILIGIRVFNNKPWYRMLFLYIPAMLLSYLITGSRGSIVYSILATAALLSCKQNISLIRVGTMGLSLVVLFGLLGLLRRSMSDTTDILSNIQARSEVENEWYYELTNYQLQLRDEMVYANSHKTGYILGNSYLNLIFFAVPRSIAGDLKPNFIDGIVAEKFWNRDDVGLPLNAMSESYLNFYIFGVLCIFALGRIMRFVTNYVLLRQEYLTTCIAITLSIYAQTCSTTYLVYVTQVLLILTLILKVFRRDKPQINIL